MKYSFLLGWILATYLSQAQITLDNTFGTGGRVVTNYAIYNQSMTVVGNKIILAGRSVSGLTVFRYNLDGTLDNSFGTGGMLATDLSAYFMEIASVVRQNDGKFLVSGSGIYQSPNRRVFVIRVNEDGTLDNSFGENGVTINDTLINGDCNTVFTNNYTGGWVAITADNKIVQAGNFYSNCGNENSFYAQRYLSNGKVDTSFRFQPIYLVKPLSVEGIMLNDDGTPILYGNGYGWGLDSNTYVPVYTCLDQSDPYAFAPFFGTLPAPWHSETNFRFKAMKRHKDGCVFAGYWEDNNLARSVIGRVDSNYAKGTASGSIVKNKIDSTFGGRGDGYKVINHNGSLEVNSIEVLSDNSVLVAGFINSNTLTKFDFVIIKLDEHGNPDASFGTNGILITDFSQGLDGSTCMAFQPDGKLLVAGSTNDGGLTDKVAIARYAGIAQSIGEHSIMEIHVYPNPGNDILVIDAANIERVSICDMQGRLVESFGSIEQPLDISVLNPGMYVAQVLTATGKGQVRFIKQ